MSIRQILAAAAIPLLQMGNSPADNGHLPARAIKMIINHDGVMLLMVDENDVD